MPRTHESDLVEVYRSGLAHCSVCAPKSMSREDVERYTNMNLPTGISSKWMISTDPKFATGDPNPTACERDSTRMHYLMEC